MKIVYNRKAFTMVELIFVIIIIGILSAIAIPKFSETANIAYLSKANSVYMTVSAALATERQKRVLTGSFTPIGDLGDTTYAFNKFDTSGNDILAFPETKCAAGATACWARTDATHYVYKFPDSSDGEAKFKLLNNKLVCDNDAADCAKIIQ